MRREFARFAWTPRLSIAALAWVPLFWTLSLIGHGFGECRPDDAGCRVGEPSALLGELARGLVFAILLALVFRSVTRGLVALLEPRLGSGWAVAALLVGFMLVGAAAGVGALTIYIRAIA